MFLNSYKFFSPLEQFEINSYNTFLSYETIFPLEYFENFFINFGATYIIYTKLDVILIIFFIGIFETYFNQKGFTFLFIFVGILLIGFNGMFFIDFLILTTDSALNMSTYSYVTVFSQAINIYTVIFCFIFSFFVLYFIYNKMLSNNTNTLIPTLYQILAENLYKLSLNLFYSILGKHISIPEFFIKINTIFIFLIISNIQGMIPYMSTLTSALTNTFFIALALFISILTTLLDKKGINYFLNLFMPSGCPILLSLLIIPIELISYSFRLVSLSVRLFANMMAGHTLLKVIVGFS